MYYRYWLSPPSEIVIDILMSISRVLDLELNISVMSPNILLEKKKKKKNQAQKVSGLSAITHPVAQSTNLKCIFHFFCFLPMSHASSPSYKSCSSLSILTIVQTAFSSQFTHGISHSCFPSHILNLKPSEWSLKNVITTCQVYVSKLPKSFSLKSNLVGPTGCVPSLPSWLYRLIIPFLLTTFQSHYLFWYSTLQVLFLTHGRLLPLLGMFLLSDLFFFFY